MKAEKEKGDNAPRSGIVVLAIAAVAAGAVMGYRAYVGS